MKNLFLPLLLISISTVFSQKKITNSQALNIISKQAMLSQRMAKDKMFKLHNTKNKDSEIELASSVILFEKNIKTLASIPLDTKIQEQITGLELIWIGYKKNILSKKAQSNKKVMEFNDIILDECNKIYDGILKSAKSENSYPYNSKNKPFTTAVIKTNDLKYLSQRLALYYASYFYKTNTFDNEHLKSIIKNIDQRVAKASKIKNENTHITKNINELELEWNDMKTMLNSVTTNEFISPTNSPKPGLIFEKCNNLLKSSDKLSRVYKRTSEIN